MRYDVRYDDRSVEHGVAHARISVQDEEVAIQKAVSPWRSRTKLLVTQIAHAMEMAMFMAGDYIVRHSVSFCDTMYLVSGQGRGGRGSAPFALSVVEDGDSFGDKEIATLVAEPAAWFSSAARMSLLALLVAGAPRRPELDSVGAPVRRAPRRGRGGALVPPEDTLALLPGAEPYVHDKGHCLPCRARRRVPTWPSAGAASAPPGREPPGAAAGRCHAAARVAAGAAGAGRRAAAAVSGRRAAAALAASAASAPRTPQPPARRKRSAATAEARGEEIEALAAIYGDDFERCGAWGAKIRLDSERARRYLSGGRERLPAAGDPRDTAAAGDDADGATADDDASSAGEEDDDAALAAGERRP
ncbi:phosphorelay sensor kinase [Aureococcus anophagefferens]|nr:phosphorelay sensor kinase [Aureococcus anophagefferens]